MPSLNGLNPSWIAMDVADFDLGTNDFSMEAWWSYRSDRWHIHKFKQTETEWDE